MTLIPGKVYMAYGEPHQCVSVNTCRAVLVPVATPWESKKVSVSAKAEIREVKR